MKGKKLFYVGMAAAMLMTAAIPSASGAQETTITGKYVDSSSAIKVAIDSKGDAQINPFALPYKVKVGVENGEDVLMNLETGGQIATKPLLIVNNGEDDLDVEATAIYDSKKLTKGMKITTKDVKPTGKEINLKFEAKPSALDKDAYATASDTAIAGFKAANVVDEFNKWGTEDDAHAEEAVSIQVDKKVPKTGATSLGTLKGMTSKTAGSYQDGSVMLYRLSGTCSETPKKEWTKDDSFEVKVAFTFKGASKDTGTESGS